MKLIKFNFKSKMLHFKCEFCYFCDKKEKPDSIVSDLFYDYGGVTGI